MEGQGTIRVGVKDGLWLLIAAAAFLGLSGWLGSRAAGVGMQRLEHSGAPSVR
jgi:ABC-type transport system involved in cytochrome bd biosynthesis fused ATPase/permease subunit